MNKINNNNEARRSNPTGVRENDEKKEKKQ
jgi:hypothetical protein